jgi:predicted transcriptional regulator
MASDAHLDGSRRERQILEVLFRLGKATAAEVQHALLEPPSYSAVRAALALLVEKGHVRHEKDGRRYVYAPTADRGRARKSAARRMLDTFFAGSVEQAVASLLDVKSRELGEDEYARLRRLIDDARAKGGSK